MKKGLVFALLLALVCVLPLMAFAVECPNGHNLDDIYPENILLSISEIYHGRYYYWECPTCGQGVELVGEINHHLFSGNYCIECGAERIDKETNRNNAIIRGDDVVGRQLFVLWPGEIYDSVNGKQLVSVSVFDQFYVNSYQLDQETPWVQISSIERTDEPIGWIKAEIALINKTPVEIDKDLLIGKKVMIITTSGKARTGAGTEYPDLAYVHYGEKYTIKDVETAANGTQWYKFDFGEAEYWVSAGLCEIMR